MNLDPETKGPLVGFGLVMLSIVLSWLTGIAWGGFKIGHLARRIEVVVKQSRLAAFWDVFQRRLTELGFCSTNIAGQYVQGGTEVGESLTAFTHARTKKLLTVATVAQPGEEVKVEMALRYLVLIVGDTGESAYRDALLDYVSGKTDGMRPVTNRSFAAVNSLVGGILSWTAVLFLRSIQFEPLWWPLLIVGASAAGIGVMAVIAIRAKPAELSGTWLAIAGILLAGTATVFAFLPGLAMLK